MDLIGNIKFIENRLGEHKPSYSRGKPAQKNTRSDAADEEENAAESSRFSTEDAPRLGRKVDTTA